MNIGIEKVKLLNPVTMPVDEFRLLEARRVVILLSAYISIPTSSVGEKYGGLAK